VAQNATLGAARRRAPAMSAKKICVLMLDEVHKNYLEQKNP